MSESNEPVEAPDAAMTRLEAALDRIERSAKPQARLEERPQARLEERPQARLEESARPVAGLEELAVAARLDTLIMQLRSALAEATM